MCLDTAWRLEVNSSAKAFGVMACEANKSKIALLVGSAIAQNTSRLVSIICKYLVVPQESLWDKYKCNYLIAQIYQELFEERVHVR
jgi:hypothetical protein